MTITYTGNLKLALPTTGTEAGAWGDVVNQQITTLLDQSVSGTVSLTAMTNADYTLTNGGGNAANEARYMALLVPATLTLTVARNIIVPSTSKAYIIRNLSTGGFAVTLKTSAGSGISVPNGKTMALYCNGTNVIDGSDYFTGITLGTALPTTSGGTGYSSYTVGDLVYASTTTALSPLADTATGNALISGGIGVAPSYGKIGLTTHVSGTLPVANGGTGVTTSTGSGNTVLSTSPTLVTPALGTPTALVGTNITGTAAGLTAGNVTTNANMTGAVTSVGNATSLGSFTSANLAGALTDETGSGAAVFANSPTLVTPALGTPSSGVVTNLTGTASININGTVGATTANTGAFTTLSASTDATIFDLTIGRGLTGAATNTAIGVTTLASVTTGSKLTAIGNNALNKNTTGIQNCAVGSSSSISITTGQFNTAVGHSSLTSNVGGFNNTAIGNLALDKTTASSSTAIGSDALTNATTGSRNVAVGANCLQNLTTGSGNTAINPLTSSGSYAPVFDPTTENNRLCMGSTAVTNAYVQVAWTVVSDARDKTDFAPVPHGLDFVTKLKPTAYRYKANREATEGHGPLRYGFKAQDVLAAEGANPVIVDAEDPEKLRFNDQSMLAVLVNAIKELKAEFDAYKATHP